MSIALLHRHSSTHILHNLSAFIEQYNALTHKKLADIPLIPLTLKTSTQTDLWTHSSPVNKLERLSRDSQNPSLRTQLCEMKVGVSKRERATRAKKSLSCWACERVRELQICVYSNHHGDPNPNKKLDSWAFNESSAALSLFSPFLWIHSAFFQAAVHEASRDVNESVGKCPFQ